MKIVLKTDQFIVIDDLLDVADFELIWNQFQSTEFEFIQSRKWIKINRLLDGNPLYGKVMLSERTSFDNAPYTYPSKTGMDILCSALLSNLDEFEYLIGKHLIDWQYFFVRPYLYPAGTGLSWHDDYGKNSGSYVFFVHQTWNVQWGGELLVSESSCDDMKRHKSATNKFSEMSFLGPYIDNSDENLMLLKSGYGQFIQPKPNRLVVLRSGVQHMIKKVELSAGHNCRCSFAGFFVNQHKIDTRFD